MTATEGIVIFWFRRDLRLADNCGLCHALQSGKKVLPIFIFDTTILNRLENKKDRRVDYFHQALQQMNGELHEQHSNILTCWGKPKEVFSDLLRQYTIEAVYCNGDYEPEGIQRDREIAQLLEKKGISFFSFKDQVIFEKDEVLKSDGTPYTVYTPYSKKWKAALQPKDYQPYSLDKNQFFKQAKRAIHSLESIGFEKTDLIFQAPRLEAKIIRNYEQYRNIPALDHTSHLGIALRFGTISIRQCVKFALQHSEVWLNELIWREFFMQILYHFPRVEKYCFKEQYENIPWINNEEEFQRWCQGKTGYPIVDAGMRQLNETGQMPNRVRMIAASFLTKHLLIDWRWGEAYFAQKLLDYDLASNNGNWQWVSGCGCDAAPYFRIFNPDEQTKKFDKDLKYIKQWNPDFDKTLSPPIVEHSFARHRALAAYKKALQEE